jgi:hypothetical protein
MCAQNTSVLLGVQDTTLYLMKEHLEASSLYSGDHDNNRCTDSFLQNVGDSLAASAG